ncbi:MAG TPA: LysR family transcriptional regulator [Dongiaceae bacterium]|nr:LysR family transcriptional regulator [Dongiaceae bacterium]
MSDVTADGLFFCGPIIENEPGRLSGLTVQAIEMGGFSAAARRLNMSATMASSHVQALEEQLGACLLPDPEAADQADAVLERRHRDFPHVLENAQLRGNQLCYGCVMRSRGSSCLLRAPIINGQLDLKAGSRRQVEERAEAELIETPLQQVIETRLCDAEPLRRLALGDFPALDLVA